VISKKLIVLSIALGILMFVLMSAAVVWSTPHSYDIEGKAKLGERFSNFEENPW